MPVLRFRLDRLSRLTGLDRGQLEEALFRLKCEVEFPEEGVIEVEVNPDRPDMYIGEGVARAVKGLLGLETGWEPPETVDSGLVLRVERVPRRPYIAAAVVYNVNVDEEFMEELIQFQEKLHETVGRRRRKVAIGFHDLEKLPSRELSYRLSSLDTVFKPLDYGVEMTARRLAEIDERGEKYLGLALHEGDMHPFLYSGDTVIAMPPVINSDVTRVEPGTRHLFIDVTGTSAEAVAETLDVIVYTLAERPGAKVGLVRLEGEAPWSTTPLATVKLYEVSVDSMNSWLGTSLDEEAAAGLLARMRHRAEPLGGGRVKVEVPPFRVDVISEVDLYEDVAIAIGYHEMGPRKPGKRHGGALTWETRLARAARDILVGLGFTEVLQLILTSPSLVEAAGLKDEAVEVLNPVQLEYSVLRPTMLIPILQTLKFNQHRNKPVKVFEIGHIVKRREGRIVEDLVLAMGVLDEEASFEVVQAPLYSLLQILGVDFTAEPGEAPGLMEGRTAILRLPDGRELGRIGEVHPALLESVGIEYPVAYAEVSLGVLAEWRSRTSSP